MKIVFSSFFALLLIQVSGCGDDNQPPAGSEYDYDNSQKCIVGSQDSCFCDDGSRGVMTCREDGLGFTECSCIPPSAATPFVTASTGGQPSTTNGSQRDAGSTPVKKDSGGVPFDASQEDGGGILTDDPQGGTGGTDVFQPPTDVYAPGIRIREIAIYQGPKIPLVRDGQSIVDRNAPVVIGRDAMLRVFVEPLSGFQPRNIRVTLQLESSTNPVDSQEVTQNVTDGSREEAMQSTVNFKIPGDQIVADLSYAVSLLETAGVTTSSAAHEDARWPREPETSSKLSPRKAGPVDLMLVPYRYTADRSGRIPSTSDEILATYEAYFREYYPITQINLSVHEPVDYTGWVTSNVGWEQWLDFHCALRDSEQPDPKLVYYGLLNPAETMFAYGGGVVGISYVPTPSSNIRCSVGLGFGDEISATTMTHEVGHSFGLEHAPCGVSGGPFPYADAKIGTWAYIMTLDSLLDPNLFYDVMSYCEPTYISDYNYQRLFQRIRYLNMQFMRIPLPQVTYHRILLDREGNLSYRGTTVHQQLSAEEEPVRQVELFDAQGRSRGKEYAFWMPFSLEPAGVYWVPEQDREVKSVQIEDGKQRVVLP